ncbi:hypothetical protein ACHHYP_13684 [Achlya hypogyna]|uniref:Xylose isomerase-like TIM barrel domain-containing protein n=1 Tax=Achlya hypogyna TaxID=1202772 RepID=A0A1V9YEW9_ACHHY|nr:hypothetical protein ACHHYP_13684 [Achlya hypogyna]
MRRSSRVLARAVAPSTASLKREATGDQATTKKKIKRAIKPEAAISPKETKKPTAKQLEKLANKDRELCQYLETLETRRKATAHTNKVIGAHVSGAGGLENAVFNAAKIGAQAFALFTRSQRTWHSKPLESGTIDAFKQAMRKFGYKPNDVVPHGSYLLNCGSPDPVTLAKSREGLLDEVLRCQQLGLSLYNFHPGSTKGEIPVEQCLDLIAESIALALDKTEGVTILIENMSCQGSTVGGKFTELRGIIDRVPDRHRTRVGVCLDTCHAFAAGWDIKDSYEATMTEFDSVVGLEHLKAVHLNDSKGVLACHADRHENIGKGRIGIDAFKALMNDPRFNAIPMILETPFTDDAGYEAEITLLYDLCKAA